MKKPLWSAPINTLKGFISKRLLIFNTIINNKLSFIRHSNYQFKHAFRPRPFNLLKQTQSLCILNVSLVKANVISKPHALGLKWCLMIFSQSAKKN